MAKKKIADYLSEWMEEFGKENPYELSRSEFVKEGGTWYLRVYVDKIDAPAESSDQLPTYGYMSSDDCEVVSRYLSEQLDREDPIEQNYYLEVSSPGMDRPLICEKDFVRFKGEAIEIKLYEAINGKKMLEGTLEDYKDGVISIKTEKEIIQLPKDKAAKINLAVIF